MSISRRRFVKASVTSAVLPWIPGTTATGEEADSLKQTLDEIERAPVLRGDLGAEAVVIESMELLRVGNEYLVRVRTKDGAESVVVAHSSKMRDAYPIFLNRVAPFFAGKDARQIESLMWELYRWKSNYKYQGLAFWICVAAAEIAILNLLGQMTDQSIGDLFGGIVRKDIALYRASGNRGNSPEEEVEYLQKIAEEIGTDAVKMRLGGRMNNNRDSLPGRTEALIPLARKALGDDFTLYADSNSSYDVENSLRIGRLMEEHRYAFFEEPCPFDQLWETKQVADQLEIPVAGGEQEFSRRRFRWMIENRGVDIVQPDLFYYGGFLRCTKVARMAAAAGMDCTVHMSGTGLGYLYTLHFASFTPNAGRHQEFKGTNAIPVECATSDLTCTEGKMKVPTGAGLGVTIAPDYLRKAKEVTTG